MDRFMSRYEFYKQSIRNFIKEYEEYNLFHQSILIRNLRKVGERNGWFDEEDEKIFNEVLSNVYEGIDDIVNVFSMKGLEELWERAKNSGYSDLEYYMDFNNPRYMEFLLLRKKKLLDKAA